MASERNPIQNLLFSLPDDLIQKVYEYYTTFRSIFNNILSPPKHRLGCIHTEKMHQCLEIEEAREQSYWELNEDCC